MNEKKREERQEARGITESKRTDCKLEELTGKTG
jgi:hypothetical protein